MVSGSISGLFGDVNNSLIGSVHTGSLSAKDDVTLGDDDTDNIYIRGHVVGRKPLVFAGEVSLH